MPDNETQWSLARSTPWLARSADGLVAIRFPTIIVTRPERYATLDKYGRTAYQQLTELYLCATSKVNLEADIILAKAGLQGVAQDRLSRATEHFSRLFSDTMVDLEGKDPMSSMVYKEGKLQPLPPLIKRSLESQMPVSRAEVKGWHSLVPESSALRLVVSTAGDSFPATADSSTTVTIHLPGSLFRGETDAVKETARLSAIDGLRFADFFQARLSPRMSTQNRPEDLQRSLDVSPDVTGWLVETYRRFTAEDLFFKPVSVDDEEGAAAKVTSTVVPQDQYTLVFDFQD